MNWDVSAYLTAFGGKDNDLGSAVPESSVDSRELRMASVVQPRGNCGKTAGNAEITVPVCSDEFLLERLRKGDREALALLFRRYARMVRTVAHRIVRDAAEADDVLQEVFLFVFRKCSLFDAAQGSARSWIVQVTYHRAIDRRRHLVSRHFYANAELDETVLTNDERITDTAFYECSMEGTLGTETLGRIDRALSSDQRRTIQLYFFDGYSFEEIAKLTGQTLGNVRNHHYRGLERIRRLIFAPKQVAK
jgi:RNA polymerase sigma-70 factor, ECF subfamily